MLSHFSGLEVGLAVQHAHSPPVLRLVIGITQLHSGLFSPVAGAVARLPPAKRIKLIKKQKEDEIRDENH